MIEFGVENFKSLSEFDGEKIPVATKPCLLFSGSLFETHDEMKRVKNLLADFFRGPRVPKVRLQGRRKKHIKLLVLSSITVTSLYFLAKKYLVSFLNYFSYQMLSFQVLDNNLMY